VADLVNVSETNTLSESLMLVFAPDPNRVPDLILQVEVTPITVIYTEI